MPGSESLRLAPLRGSGMEHLVGQTEFTLHPQRFKVQGLLGLPPLRMPGVPAMTPASAASPAAPAVGGQLPPKSRSASTTSLAGSSLPPPASTPSKPSASQNPLESSSTVKEAPPRAAIEEAPEAAPLGTTDGAKEAGGCVSEGMEAAVFTNDSEGTVAASNGDEVMTAPLNSGDRAVAASTDGTVGTPTSVGTPTECATMAEPTTAVSMPPLGTPPPGRARKPSIPAAVAARSQAGGDA